MSSGDDLLKYIQSKIKKTYFSSTKVDVVEIIHIHVAILNQLRQQAGGF